MSGAFTLNAQAATWLAGLDPALALLPRALPRDVDGERCSLDDVRWTPGEGCRLAYRVLHAGSAPTYTTVEVTPTRWARYDYRDDARLPGLAAVADPVFVSGLLAPLVGESVTGCLVEPVRYRPGSRCVLRCELRTPSSTITLYAKMYRPERFAEVSSTAGALAAMTDPGRLVADVAGVWPDLHVVVGRAVEGRRMSVVLGDPAVPAAQRARLAHRLGDLLARFHAQSGVPAPPWSGADQVAALTDPIGAAECADPLLGKRLRTSLDVLADTIPAPAIDVLGHGAFRAGQVIHTDEGRLVVLDTDGTSRCDPARDLGNVLAHLLWQGIKQPGQRPALDRARGALVSGYLSRAGGRDAIDPRSLLWWRAAALLQVAVRRYRRLDVPDWRLVPVLADAVEALLATPRRTSAPANGTDLLDRRQMTTLLRLALAPAATHPDALQLDSVEELASASGRRSVVRYAVRGLDGAEAVPVVGKAFTESHRARLLHDHLEALTAGPFGRGSLRVPEPVGLLAEQRLVLYRSCEGERLDHASDPDLALAGVRGAARWLARLHTSDVRLPRRFSMTAEAGSSRRWAELIGQHHPVDAHRARGVADGWALAARAAGVFLDTPIHKDFHAGHVLIAVPTGMTSGVGAEAMAGSTIAVLDLDEARHGDPAFDVAHFCAYLELTGHPRGQVETLRTAFLDEYAARSGWADRGTFAPFSAYSWLKIAKQWTVGSGPCRGASDAERAAGVDHAMAKAESWLTA